MNAYQLKMKLKEDAKQKHNMITNDDFVTIIGNGALWYSKEEFHETVQGWVSEGYEIVKVTDIRTIYYMQVKHIPEYFKKPSAYITIEAVTVPKTYEPVFRFANDFAYTAMAMQQA